MKKIIVVICILITCFIGILGCTKEKDEAFLSNTTKIDEIEAQDHDSGLENEYNTTGKVYKQNNEWLILIITELASFGLLVYTNFSDKKNILKILNGKKI